MPTRGREEEETQRRKDQQFLMSGAKGRSPSETDESLDEEFGELDSNRSEDQSDTNKERILKKAESRSIYLLLTVFFCMMAASMGTVIVVVLTVSNGTEPVPAPEPTAP